MRKIIILVGFHSLELAFQKLFFPPLHQERLLDQLFLEFEVVLLQFKVLELKGNIVIHEIWLSDTLETRKIFRRTS